MINERITTIGVVVNYSQLDVTVDSRQVTFLGQSSAREGCSCDSRSKDSFFMLRLPF